MAALTADPATASAVSVRRPALAPAGHRRVCGRAVLPMPRPMPRTSACAEASSSSTSSSSSSSSSSSAHHLLQRYHPPYRQRQLQRRSAGFLLASGQWRQQQQQHDRQRTEVGFRLRQRQPTSSSSWWALCSASADKPRSQPQAAQGAPASPSSPSSPPGVPPSPSSPLPPHSRPLPPSSLPAHQASPPSSSSSSSSSRRAVHATAAAAAASAVLLTAAAAFAGVVSPPVGLAQAQASTQLVAAAEGADSGRTLSMEMAMGADALRAREAPELRHNRGARSQLESRQQQQQKQRQGHPLLWLAATAEEEEEEDAELAVGLEGMEYVRPGTRRKIPLRELFMVPPPLPPGVGVVPPGAAVSQVHVSIAGPGRMEVSWVTPRARVAPAAAIAAASPSLTDPSATAADVATASASASSWVGDVSAADDSGDSASVAYVVRYGLEPDKLDRVAYGNSTSYKFLGYRSGTIHHAVLGSEDELLAPDTVYYYRCGQMAATAAAAAASAQGQGPADYDALQVQAQAQGELLSFKTPPAGVQADINIAVVGDMGQTGWTVSTLEHIQQQNYDMLVLPGDLSYADGYQPRWDSWGALVQPLASARPWMTIVGNHEVETIPLLSTEPFTAYTARWAHAPAAAASASPSPLYYSFDAGPTHWVMLAAYGAGGFEPGTPQHAWLSSDLAGVDRGRTPWVFVALHTPWYNSNLAHRGDGEEMREAMEAVLYEGGVDAVFAGHVHAYERTARVYGGKEDPCGIVHVTIGDGGNYEGLARTYEFPPPSWSLVQEASFGHGELQLRSNGNGSGRTAEWRWHRNDDDANVVADSVFIRSHVADAPGGSRDDETGMCTNYFRP